jgi:hypothetical protein
MKESCLYDTGLGGARFVPQFPARHAGVQIRNVK